MTIAVPTDTRHWRSGLSHAVRAEWTKLGTLRSTRWTLFVALVGTVLVSFLSTHGVERHQPPGFYAVRGLRSDQRLVGRVRSGDPRHRRPERALHDRRVRQRHHPLVPGGDPASTCSSAPR